MHKSEVNNHIANNQIKGQTVLKNNSPIITAFSEVLNILYEWLSDVNAPLGKVRVLEHVCATMEPGLFSTTVIEFRMGKEFPVTCHKNCLISTQIYRPLLNNHIAS